MAIYVRNEQGNLKPLEIPALQGRDGITPNIQVGEVVSLESTEEPTVSITGDKENPVLNFGIPSGYGGEKLIAEYVHRGNQEIYFSEIDYATGIATTTETHGIKAKTEIMIVPNDWTLNAMTNHNLSVPIEWTTHNTRITVSPIDETHLLVANNAGTSIISVNLDDISNKNVDCTKFHFEIPIGWQFTNLPENILYFRLIKKGYAKSCGQYRYVSWRIKCDDGKVYSPSYLNPLGIPLIPNAQSTHCVFAIENWLVDARDYSIMFTRDSMFYGRRKGYSTLVYDGTREQTKGLISNDSRIVNAQLKHIGLSSIGAYSNHYAYLANGTSIQLYDLGGIDNEK